MPNCVLCFNLKRKILLSIVIIVVVFSALGNNTVVKHATALLTFVSFETVFRHFPLFVFVRMLVIGINYVSVGLVFPQCGCFDLK